MHTRWSQLVVALIVITSAVSSLRFGAAFRLGRSFGKRSASGLCRWPHSSSSSFPCSQVHTSCGRLVRLYTGGGNLPAVEYKYRLSRSGQRIIPITSESEDSDMPVGGSASKSSSSTLSKKGKIGLDSSIGVGADCPGLDRSKFDQTLRLVALRVPAKSCTQYLNALKPIMFSRQRMKRVFNDDNDVEKRLLLLTPEVKLEHFSSPLSSSGGGDGIVTAEHIQFVKDNGGEAVDFDLRLGYDNMVVDEVLRELLPAKAEVPSSFEAAGHVAHLNIREELVAYKGVIGQVILDKNYPQIRTVVNKVGEITNEFRTFPLEVIAGLNDLNVTLRESGANFTFNFADVYWNSRLQMEHSRIIDLIRREGGSNGNPAVVADMMAGVGPFAVPLALKPKEDNNLQKHGKRGRAKGVDNSSNSSTGGGDSSSSSARVIVYANDKNPKSYEAMVKNAQLNKIRVNDIGAIDDSKDDTSGSNLSSLSHPNTTLHLYNACGREFLRHLVGREGIMPSDILMNLPASATDFLDAMQDIGTMYQKHHSHVGISKGQIEAILPRIHVYGFSTADDHILDMAERACAVMGCTVSDLGTRAAEGVNLASRQLNNKDVDETVCTWAGHNVRDVAPKKLMICLSFYVPSVVAFRGKDGSGEEPEAKRRKV